jgi:hypothetical protein
MSTPIVGMGGVALLVFVIMFPRVACPRREDEGEGFRVGDPIVISRAELDRRVSAPKVEFVADGDACR